jgi:hypothetical protein
VAETAGPLSTYCVFFTGVLRRSRRTSRQHQVYSLTFPLEDPKEGSQYITIKSGHGELRAPRAQAGDLEIRTGEAGFDCRRKVKDREPSPKARTVSKTVILNAFDGKIYPVPYASVRKWEVSSDFSLLPTPANATRIRNQFCYL